MVFRSPSCHAKPGSPRPLSALAWRAIVERTTDILYAKDRHGRILMMNTAGARLYGVSPEALIGHDLLVTLPSGEMRRLGEVDEEIMRTGEPRTFEMSITVAGVRHVHQTLEVPYRDRAGEVIGVVASARDITEQKAAEHDHAWLTALVDSSAEAIVGEALDGTIASWNAAAERLYGYRRDEVLGKPVAMLVPPEGHAELASVLARVRSGEPIENYETIRRRKEGRDVTVTLTLSAVRDAAGTIIGISKIARDITECADRVRLASEAAQIGMWFWNLENQRLTWTPTCRRLLGIEPGDEASYPRWLAAVHPDDRAQVDEAVQRARAERSDLRVEHRALWPDGSVHQISGHGRIVYEAGVPVRMMGTATDVTAQKQTEAERVDLQARAETACAEAQAATLAKDDFLGVLSHELRTPLQSMLGWTQLLKARVHDAPAMEKGLLAIERSARAQARLIEDLLDTTRIAEGKLRLTRERVELSQVVAAAVESASAGGDEERLHVRFSGCPRCEVDGDPGRLQQVVANLLTNAQKFTPPGGHVDVLLQRDGAKARIVVADSGRGISAEFLPHVFERWRQSERTAAHARGGLGLGLAIVHQLVEMHGGSVTAESPGEGRGATFTVTLPLAGAAAPAERACG